MANNNNWKKCVQKEVLEFLLRENCGYWGWGRILRRVCARRIERCWSNRALCLAACSASSSLEVSPTCAVVRDTQQHHTGACQLVVDGLGLVRKRGCTSALRTILLVHVTHRDIKVRCSHGSSGQLVYRVNDTLWRAAAGWTHTLRLQSVSAMHGIELMMTQT